MLVAALPAAAQDRAMVPVTVDGEPVKLANITDKPAGHGPFPKQICSRANFAAFEAPPPGPDGHQIIPASTLWSTTLETHVEERRLPGRPQ